MNQEKAIIIPNSYFELTIVRNQFVYFNKSEITF
jgi:hypothetical protein